MRSRRSRPCSARSAPTSFPRARPEQGRRRRPARAAPAGNRFPDALQVSALTGEGLDELRARVAERFADRFEPVRLLVPYDEGARLAELYALGAPIEEREDGPEGVLVRARLPRREVPRFAPYLVAEARRGAAHGARGDRAAGPAAARRRRRSRAGLRRRRRARPRRRASAASSRPGSGQSSPPGSRSPIPEGYAGFVQPRSGLAARHGIGVVNSPGLIDSGYRGEVRVVLHNTDRGDLRGRARDADRPARRRARSRPSRLVEVDELPASERGERGFGSSQRLTWAPSRASGSRRSCAGGAGVLLCRHEKRDRAVLAPARGRRQLGREPLARAPPRARGGDRDRGRAAARGARRDRRLDRARAQLRRRSTSSTSSSRATSAAARSRRSPRRTRPSAAIACSRSRAGRRRRCTRRSSASSRAGSPATRSCTSGRSGRRRARR